MASGNLISRSSNSSAVLLGGSGSPSWEGTGCLQGSEDNAFSVKSETFEWHLETAIRPHFTVMLRHFNIVCRRETCGVKIDLFMRVFAPHGCLGYEALSAALYQNWRCEGRVAFDNGHNVEYPISVRPRHFLRIVDLQNVGYENFHTWNIFCTPKLRLRKFSNVSGRLHIRVHSGQNENGIYSKNF